MRSKERAAFILVVLTIIGVLVAWSCYGFALPKAGSLAGYALTDNLETISKGYFLPITIRRTKKGATDGQAKEAS